MFDSNVPVQAAAFGARAFATLILSQPPNVPGVIADLTKAASLLGLQGVVTQTHAALTEELFGVKFTPPPPPA